MSESRTRSLGLIDFHCHLDLYDDFSELVDECEAQGIYTLTVTTTPRAWPRNRELTENTRYVRAALGLHPQLIEDRASDLALFEQYLEQTRYVGEVGLDAGPRYYRSLALQEKVFARILSLCAEQGNKILTIHSVRTVPLVLKLIESNLPPDRGRVVLHWFTGSRSQTQRATELGCYFSINGQMLKTASHQARVLELPLERILTETDGPFVSVASRPVRPQDVLETVLILAELHALQAAEMASILRSNLRSLLSTTA